MANEQEQAAAEAPEEVVETPEVEEEVAPPSVDEIAARMGWVPKEKFKGEETKWKPAEQFILDGKDIQERSSRELKEMRVTLDTISKTSGQLMADKLQQQHKELAAQYAAAVEKGDPDEAFRVSQEISGVIAQKVAPAPPRSAPPEATDWVERNPWMKPSAPQYDPVAANAAIAICNQYAVANPNMPPGEQIAKTEAILRNQFPHLFTRDKGPAQVNGNISRNTSTPAKTGKTAADLPKEARVIADDLVERGLIKSNEDYAKNYFAAQAKGR